MNIKLFLSLCKIVSINFFVVIGILLLSMFPRGTNQTDIQQFSIKYYFSISSYLENIRNYFKSRMETKDLGVTWVDRIPVLEEMSPFVMNSMILFLNTLFISILASIVLGILLSKILHRIKPTNKFPSWMKVHDIFIILTLYCFVSINDPKITFNQVVFLSTAYPTIVMTRYCMTAISSSSNQSMIKNLKVSLLTFLTKFRSIVLTIMTSVFLVEWLSRYKGLTSLFIASADFSTKKFARSFRTYEYDLLIVMMVTFVIVVLAAEWISYIARKGTRSVSKSWLQGISSLGMKHLLIILGIVILILFPKNGFQDYTNVAYTFSPTEYKHNITSLVSSIVNENSLGKTKSGSPVEKEIAKLVPMSFKIIITAFFITLIFGILKGVLDYQVRQRWYSLLGKGSTWATIATPDFIIIFFVQWFLIFYVPSFKVMGYEHWYSYLFLGALISLHPIAYMANIVRNALEDEAGEMYVQVALAKGLPRNYIMRKHMFKNILPAICSYFSTVLLYIMSNLFIVEWFFNYSGAAHRVLNALSISNKIISVRGSFEATDAPLLFGILVCFLIPLIVVQVAGTLIKFKYNPVGRD